MPGLSVVTLIALLGSLSVAAICGYIYLSGKREPGWRIWVISWTLQSLRYGVEAWPGGTGPAWLPVLQHAFLLASAIFLWLGMEMFVSGQRRQGRLKLATLLAGGVLLLPRLLGLGAFWQDTLTFSFTGAAYLYSGFLALRRGLSGVGPRLAGWALLLAGLHKLDYPLVTGFWPHLVPAGYLLAAALFQTVAVAIVISALEDARRKQVRHVREAVLVLAATVEARDVYTLNHSRSVAALASALAEKMGLGKQEVENVHFAGLLHDVGKIGVPDYILQKPGKLSPEEFAEIKLHPEAGYRILQAAGESFLPILDMVRHHHERWDGRGYPSGLRGPQIPLGAAILAVADAYDAMVSNRPYRDARTEARALEQIRAGAGSQFHPQVARVFLQHFAQIREQLAKQPPAMLAAGAEMAPEPAKPDLVVLAHAAPRQVEHGLRPFDYRVRYKGLLDAAYDAVLVIDAGGRIVDWNRKAERDYGYPGQELGGLRFCDLDAAGHGVPPAAGDEERLWESLHRRRDGTIFPVEVSMRSFVQNGHTYWIAIARDITRRKQSEQELRERERKYRLLFEQVSDAIIVHDLSLRILEVNEAACRRLGYSREELLRMTIADIDAAGSRSLAYLRLQLLQREGHHIFRAEQIARDGLVIPVEINATMIEYGGQPAVLSVQRDLRGRLEAEGYARKMIDAFPHPAYLVRKDRQVVAVNRAAQAAGVLAGRPCYETVWGRDAICPYCQTEQAFTTQEALTVEIVVSGARQLACWVPVSDNLFLHYIIRL